MVYHHIIIAITSQHYRRYTLLPCSAFRFLHLSIFKLQRINHSPSSWQHRKDPRQDLGHRSPWCHSHKTPSSSDSTSVHRHRSLPQEWHRWQYRRDDDGRDSSSLGYWGWRVVSWKSLGSTSLTCHSSPYVFQCPVKSVTPSRASKGLSASGAAPSNPSLSVKAPLTSTKRGDLSWSWNESGCFSHRRGPNRTQWCVSCSQWRIWWQCDQQKRRCWGCHRRRELLFLRSRWECHPQRLRRCVHQSSKRHLRCRNSPCGDCVPWSFWYERRVPDQMQRCYCGIRPSRTVRGNWRTGRRKSWNVDLIIWCRGAQGCHNWWIMSVNYTNADTSQYQGSSPPRVYATARPSSHAGTYFL